MPFVVQDGAQIYYEVDGSGEGGTVVLVTGLGLSAKALAPMRASLVEKGYRVVALDPRGAGQSDKPAGPYLGETMAADVEAVFVGANTDTAHVVGFSMGGLIAQEYAIRYPHRIEKLVLASTYARADEWCLRILELRRELLTTLGPATHFKMSFLFVFSPYAFRHHREIIERIESMLATIPLEPYLAQLQFCIDHDAQDRLTQIRAETLVTCGEHDILTSPFQSEELAAGIPNAQLLIVPLSSHGMLYERPTGVVDDLHEFFLKGRTG